MTQTTDYHGWEIPTEGGDTDQWDSILNDLLDGPLEASVALRGPITDRPTTAPADALFHATDRDEFYRYDADVGGWVTASAHIDEARQRYDSAQGPRAAYRQVGSGSLGSELRHTQQTVGTRHMGAHWPLVDPHFRADDFSYSNSGVSERIQLINYSFLEQPPNMVPVLRGQCIATSDTSGSSFEVGVKLKTQPSGEWLMTFSLGGDANTHELYDETYLNEVPYGSAARGSDTLPGTQIEVHADIDGTPSAGTIFGSSQLMLDWEVV